MIMCVPAPQELRTPLNGIIGLSESLMAGACGALPEKAMQVCDCVPSGAFLVCLCSCWLAFR